MISLATNRLAASLSRPQLLAPLLGRLSFASSTKMSHDHTTPSGAYISMQDSAAAARAAGGGGAGLGASRGVATSAAAGAPEGMPAHNNIVDAITADHKRLFSYYEQLQGPGLSHGQREHLRHLIVHDLSVHSLSEEEVLYPALKNAFGKDIRDHVLDEHTSLKKILLDIDRMGADDPAFKGRLDDLYHELRHHVKEEEENVLPQFASRVPATDLESLGERFEKVKGRVPTRPHALAPDKPITGNVIADRMTAPIDKMRDRAAGRDVA